MGYVLGVDVLLLLILLALLLLFLVLRLTPPPLSLSLFIYMKRECLELLWVMLRGETTTQMYITVFNKSVLIIERWCEGQGERLDPEKVKTTKDSLYIHLYRCKIRSSNFFIVCVCVVHCILMLTLCEVNNCEICCLCYSGLITYFKFCRSSAMFPAFRGVWEKLHLKGNNFAIFVAVKPKICGCKTEDLFSPDHTLLSCSTNLGHCGKCPR